MNKISTEEVLASSSGLIASLLNVIPGLGSGYIYQRRWLPYFLTAGSVTLWIVSGIILQGDKETTRIEQLIGISGLFLISIITSVEANLAFKKAVKITDLKEAQIKSSSKKGWFK